MRVPASRYNPLNAQASVSDDPDTQPKPKPEIVDRSPAPTPKGTLTADDLRAWGNSKTAMIAQPVLTIMDRWPDEELPQQRNTPVPAAQASSTSGRAIIMTVIIFMALSAVLLTTFRKINGAGACLPGNRCGFQFARRPAVVSRRARARTDVARFLVANDRCYLRSRCERDGLVEDNRAILQRARCYRAALVAPATH